MRYKVFNVLQHECPGALRSNDTGNIKKQGSLGGALESVRAPKSIFLAHPGDAEWLAGKSSKQHVMVRDFLGRMLSDVADKLVGIRKVLFVCDLGKGIPLAREYTLPPMGLEARADSAYARKKINNGKCGAAGLVSDFPIALDWRVCKKVSQWCLNQ